MNNANPEPSNAETGPGLREWSSGEASATEKKGCFVCGEAIDIITDDHVQRPTNDTVSHPVCYVRAQLDCHVSTAPPSALEIN